MIANIANLTRWEWFKLRRRWMLWIVLVFAILFAQLAVWGQFFSYENLQSTGGEITVPATLQQQQGRLPRTVACNDLLSGDQGRQPADLDVQVIAGLAAQCRQQAATQPARLARAYQGFTLPGSISTALVIVQALALILIAILTASAIGIDYGSGTLRSVLTQGTGRWPYLTAKILTLAILTALGLLVALATVAISSVIAGAIAGAAPSAATVTATWADAGLALWKAWVSVLPYLALTTFVTVVARSSAAGMAIGLGYYFLEQLLIALFSSLFSWFQNVADFLLVRNISAWTQGGAGTSGGFSSLGGSLPDATHAIVVLAIYTVALSTIAFWIFERRDVQGATVG
jgi:ABC-2 type transport system permease protein